MRDELPYRSDKDNTAIGAKQAPYYIWRFPLFSFKSTA
jgi:hypothetical protein